MTIRTTHLIFTVSIPVTYDDTEIDDEKAKDIVQAKVQEAIAAAADGRELYTTGRYKDCTGPRLVPRAEEGT